MAVHLILQVYFRTAPRVRHKLPEPVSIRPRGKRPHDRAEKRQHEPHDQQNGQSAQQGHNDGAELSAVVRHVGEAVVVVVLHAHIAHASHAACNRHHGEDDGGDQHDARDSRDNQTADERNEPTAHKTVRVPTRHPDDALEVETRAEPLVGQRAQDSRLGYSTRSEAAQREQEIQQRANKWDVVHEAGDDAKRQHPDPRDEQGEKAVFDALAGIAHLARKRPVQTPRRFLGPIVEIPPSGNRANDGYAGDERQDEQRLPPALVLGQIRPGLSKVFSRKFPHICSVSRAGVSRADVFRSDVLVDTSQSPTKCRTPGKMRLCCFQAQRRLFGTLGARTM